MPPFGMYNRRQTATPLPQRMPGSPGYQAPSGPLVQTLPQRAGMATQGPVAFASVPDRPFGRTMPQPTAGGMMTPGLGRPNVYPGSGMGYYRDDEYNPSPLQQGRDNAAVARDRMYGAADPAGPYSGTAGMNHFGPLQSQPEAQMTLPGPGYVPGHLDAADASRRRAQGRTAAFVQTGPPKYGLSPEMEGRRQAAIARQGDRREMLAAGRNIRANRTYGAPLRPDLFPRAEAAYAALAPGGGALGATGQTMNALVTRNTTPGVDGGPPETNWSGVSRGIYDDPKFKSDPKAAWDALRQSGMNSTHLAALIDDAEGGLFGIGADADPNYVAWLNGLREAAGLQAASQRPGYTPSGPLGPLGTPSIMGPGGESAPPLPRGTQVVRPPAGSAAPPPAPHGEGVVGIPNLTPRPVPTPPPPTRRRRPGPAYRPDF